MSAKSKSRPGPVVKKKRVSGPVVQNRIQLEGRAGVPDLVQRARQDPSSLSAGEVLHLQRAMGNRSAGRLLGGRQQELILRVPESNQTDGAVQRIMTVGVERGPKKLGRKARRKLENVRRDMARVGRKVRPAVAFTLQVVDTKDPNPATTERDGITITVNLRRWYLNMASEGEILGMLAHELGVHTLADREMKEDDPDSDRKENRQLMTHKGGLEKLITSELGITPLRGSVQDTRRGREFVPNDRRQLDHIRVAQSILYGTSSRAQKYLQTMLRMGDAIEHSNRKAKAKLSAQRDLVKVFFFDVGRLVAVDAEDNALKTFQANELIAEVFNWYQTKVIADHARQHPWLSKEKLVSIMTGKSVKWWLVKKLLGFFGSAGIKGVFKAFFG